MKKIQLKISENKTPRTKLGGGHCTQAPVPLLNNVGGIGSRNKIAFSIAGEMIYERAFFRENR